MIKLENIEKSFGVKSRYGKGTRLNVLSSVSLDIASGEYIAIRGKSGAGKSTLLNVLGLLDIPTAGNYYLNGKLLSVKNINAYSQIRNQVFGFIFQAYHLLYTLTVRENLELPYIYSDKKPDTKRVNFVAESLGIADKLNEVAKVLSGGEKQRVAIARALILDPPVLICDELTGNLDDENTRVVLDVFDEQYKKNKTLILVTHSERVAERAKKSYVMKGGSLVQQSDGVV